MPVQGGTDDGSWPFYDRHRRLLIVQSYMELEESFSTGWASIQNPFFMLERQFERRWQTSSTLSLSLSSLYYLAHSLNS